LFTVGGGTQGIAAAVVGVGDKDRSTTTGLGALCDVIFRKLRSSAAPPVTRAAAATDAGCIRKTVISKPALPEQGCVKALPTKRKPDVVSARAG